jgi:hypothetical protein
VLIGRLVRQEVLEAEVSIRLGEVDAHLPELLVGESRRDGVGGLGGSDARPTGKRDERESGGTDEMAEHRLHRYCPPWPLALSNRSG